MKHRLRSLISLILVLLLTVQLMPTVSFADDRDISGVGDTAGSGGGNGSGRWTTDRSGYRMYIIDKQGNIDKDNLP